MNEPYAVRQHQEHLDTRAIEIATKALTQINQHMHTCDQRWDETKRTHETLSQSITTGFKDVNTKIDGIQRDISSTSMRGLLRWLGVAGTTIIVLVGTIGWLFPHVIPGGK